MRGLTYVATGAEKASQAGRNAGFSVQGNSPSTDNLTRNFLLRYYLLTQIITYSCRNAIPFHPSTDDRIRENRG